MMDFGPVDIAKAEGAVLAHSVALPEGRLAKGRVLSADDVAVLREAGIERVTVSRLGPDDIDEDSAAARIGAALCGSGLRVTEAFTGRVNLVATRSGLIRVASETVHALNLVDESITLATLPDKARVAEGALAATIKIIPYGVASASVERALDLLRAPPISVSPFVGARADLILTRTRGMKDKVLEKGERVTQARMAALGLAPGRTRVVEHEAGVLAAALRESKADCVLVLTASATSDRADVGPAGLVAAGGELTRFGMPVDPGNLLFLGRLGDRPVVGLPGCARSPALNGADWVLERIAAGLDVTGEDIARMGVGGMLKEIPARPQPRGAKSRPGDRVEIILLAAGGSRRMKGRDKLLEDAGGVPLLRRTAHAAAMSGADAVHVVLPPGHPGRREALEGLDLAVVEAPAFQEGMAGSLRAGMGAIDGNAGAVIVALADMPDIAAEHYDRLIAAWRRTGKACRAVTEAGAPGHPVLFPQRHFESLSALSGDRGARSVLRSLGDEVETVRTPGAGAITDLDTPEAWAEWQDHRD